VCRCWSWHAGQTAAYKAVQPVRRRHLSWRKICYYTFLRVLDVFICALECNHCEIIRSTFHCSDSMPSCPDRLSQVVPSNRRMTVLYPGAQLPDICMCNQRFYSGLIWHITVTNKHKFTLWNDNCSEFVVLFMAQNKQKQVKLVGLWYEMLS